MRRHSGTLISICVFVLLFATTTSFSQRGLTYFSVSSLLNAGTPLALASMGQTLVILCGGFDLSSGAVVALVNALLVTHLNDSIGSQLGCCLASLAVGGTVGLFNGFIVSYLRMQSIIVTLSTMFLLRGMTLLILPSPGGSVPESLSDVLVGDAIPGVLPSALIVIAVALGVWFAIKGSRFGTAIYAVGSDEAAAHAVGIGVRRVKMMSFVIAGVFYAAAGIFITAQSGAGDPLIGNPLLLSTFTAVVLGGTLLRGGRGGCVGSIFGAFTFLTIASLLFALKISEYYSSVVESVVLLLALLANSFDGQSVLSNTLQRIAMRLRARRQRGPAAAPGDDRALSAWPAAVLCQPLPAGARMSWLRRSPDLLRFVAPAWICLVVVAIATRLAFPDAISVSYYIDRVLILAVCPAILVLGQGAVIMAGGFDLSLPWTIGFCGIITAAFVDGSNPALIWVLPLVLAIGVLIGAFNGIGIAFLGIPPIVMTLATNGILQGATLLTSGGMPQGYASTDLRWFMTGSLFGVTPVAVLLALFAVVATVLLVATPFARKVIAVGTNPRAAMLSGLAVERTIVVTYILSGLCSALVAVLLVGLLGQPSLDMGQDYLLPTIAAVVVGGTLITGGRGHYLGMLGGVLLLTVIQVFLAGTTLPFAVRDVVFGLVVLGAVLSLRERSAA